MSPIVRQLFTFLLQFGVAGLLALAIADDSFLFIPIGTDLLLVVLVARDHHRFIEYLLAAAVGSTIGVLLLDLVCRKGGEKGLQRLVKPRLLDYLKGRMEKHAALALILACLAPPPFPFGATIATASSLQYPRRRLLVLVLITRTVRFALVGWSALYFGRRIIRIANSTEFLWTMAAFITLCVIGSIASIVHWVRAGRAQ